MKRFMGLAAGLLLASSTQVLAEEAEGEVQWTDVPTDQPAAVSPVGVKLIESLLDFRKEMSAAIERCDSEWLQGAYAHDYQLFEGSGWLSGPREAINRCGANNPPSGVHSADAVGVKVRLVKPDAAIVTGTTQLSKKRGDVYVRWLAAYRLTFSDEGPTWKAAFAQVHRVADTMPGPPRPQPVRDFNLAGGVTDPNYTWEKHWEAMGMTAPSQHAELLAAVRRFKKGMAEAGKDGDTEAVYAFFAPDFTHTHGSGHVEDRSTRHKVPLNGRARGPENVMGTMTVQPLGEESVIVTQIIPFELPWGPTGYIRTATVLEEYATHGLGYRLRAGIVSSYDLALPPTKRVPSGCEPPMIGNPDEKFVYPLCE